MQSLRLAVEQYRWFAHAAAAFRLSWFKLHRLEHEVAERLRDERLQSAAFWQMLRLTALSLLLAALVVAAIAWFEYELAAYGLTNASASLQEIYADVMLGLAGMGGVFIGLYYAAVSAVATRAYSDVPTEIRFLLAADLAGRTYMRLLTFVTCFALIHLALQIAFDYTSGLAAIVALFFVAVSVVLFVQLGNRAFHLLDPTSLTQDLLRDLDYWVERALRKRRRSSAPEFQQHARLRAARAITTLDAIIDGTASVASRVSTIPELCMQLLAAQLRYVSKKADIPIESRWYPQVNVQRRWFLTSDTITTTAVQTGTGLQPDVRHDRFWLENRIGRVVERALVPLAAHGRLEELLSCLSTLADATQRRASLGDVAGCASAWTEVSESVASAIASQANADETLLLAVSDALARIPVSIGVGAREYTERFSVTKLRHHVGTLSTSTRFPFRAYPFHLVERLNWMVVRNNYEALAEGRSVSPPWYHDELLRQAEVRHLEEVIKSLLEVVPAHYERLAETLGKTPDTRLHAAFLERRLEFLSKARLAVERIVDRFTALSVEKRIDGLPWPTIDQQTLAGALAQREDELVDRMAALVDTLVALPESETVPDYAGRFLAAIAAATFAAAADGNTKRFDRLFPVLARGSLSVSEKLRAKIQGGVAFDPKLIACVAALAEFLDIAGYARVFSELHAQPEIWNRAKHVLDLVFKHDVARSATYLTAVLGLSSYGNPLGIPHMSAFRHSRRMTLSQKLRPFVEQTGGRYGYRDRVNHPSAIVRLMADQMGLGPEGLDMFALAYVHGELGVPTKQLGYKVHDMARKLERESSEALENGD